MSSPLFPELVINGQTVPQATVAAEAQNHPAPSGKPGVAWRKAAKAMAVRTLLLQEAASRNLEADCQQVGPERFETSDEALIRDLLDQAVPKTEPSEDEIRAHWSRDPERFRAPPLWEVSHILFACDPRDGEATTRAFARATAVTAQVLAHPDTFASLAKTDSECGSGSSGGTLGQLRPGDTVPEFEDAIRALKPTQITEKPVLTRHGVHIIRLDAAIEGAVLPFDNVRQKISDAMEKASWARGAREFVDTLVAAADIQGAELSPN